MVYLLIQFFVRYVCPYQSEIQCPLLRLSPALCLSRVLKVFLSRTAQRTPYMTSWRVLWLLAVILLVVLWFLVAWTSAVCQNPELSRALIIAGLTPEGLQFSMCLLDRWDYMMAVGECVLFTRTQWEQV